MQLRIRTGIFILLALILFEAFQQHYYVRTYDLAKDTDVTLFSIILAHLWRWSIWLLTAIPFYVFISRQTQQGKHSPGMGKYLLLILVMILFDIILITLVAVYRSADSVTFTTLISYFEFFIFQKGPVFLIGYVALAIYAHQFFQNQSLLVRIGELLSLKDQHNQPYHELKNKKWDDHTQVLQVKIGKRIKLIPVEDIEWIESDDYCVKIHTRDSGHYTLRTSMKKMEEMLKPYGFERLHRSAIVNTHRILEVVTGNKPAVILPRAVRIDIASNRLSTIRQLIPNGINQSNPDSRH